MKDTFGSMTELVHALPASDNYSFQVTRAYRSRVKVFAPHAGCIEPCTGPVALAIADSVFDTFVFHGLRTKDCFKTLHITSSHYDDPLCMNLVMDADVAIAIHGCDGEEPFIEVGGGNTVLRAELESVLKSSGYDVRVSSLSRKGESEANFINKARQQGVQLELSVGFRRILFPGFPRTLHRSPEKFPEFIGCLRKWMMDIESRLQRGALSSSEHTSIGCS